MDPFINALVLFVFARYVTKSRKLLGRLTEMTVHDLLTGIYDRRYFDSSLKEELDTGYK